MVEKKTVFLLHFSCEINLHSHLIDICLFETEFGSYSKKFGVITYDYFQKFLNI